MAYIMKSVISKEFIDKKLNFPYIYSYSMPDIDCLEYMCQLAQGNLWHCLKFNSHPLAMRIRMIRSFSHAERLKVFIQFVFELITNCTWHSHVNCDTFFEAATWLSLGRLVYWRRGQAHEHWAKWLRWCGALDQASATTSSLPVSPTVDSWFVI